MATVDVKDIDGKVKETCVLPDDIFNVKTNVPLIHQVVNAEMAAFRQGTHKTKTRSEVRGGGKKPYRQKGTGNARQGSIRSPQYKGGGVVHGPVPRDYSERTPKKMVKFAIRSALSNRLRTNNFYIVSNLVENDISTKKAIDIFTKNKVNVKLLVVTNNNNDYLSTRNISDVVTVKPKQINAYNIVSTDGVLWTKDAIIEFVGGEKNIKFNIKKQKDSKPKTPAKTTKQKKQTPKSAPKINKKIDEKKAPKINKKVDVKKARKTSVSTKENKGNK
jgi:large subunit ribosomal protein L4